MNREEAEALKFVASIKGGLRQIDSSRLEGAPADQIDLQQFVKTDGATAAPQTVTRKIPGLDFIEPPKTRRLPPVKLGDAGLPTAPPPSPIPDFIPMPEDIQRALAQNPAAIGSIVQLTNTPPPPPPVASPPEATIINTKDVDLFTYTKINNIRKEINTVKQEINKFLEFLNSVETKIETLLEE